MKGKDIYNIIIRLGLLHFNKKNKLQKECRHSKFIVRIKIMLMVCC